MMALYWTDAPPYMQAPNGEASCHLSPLPDPASRKTRNGKPRAPQRTRLGLPFAGNVAMLVLENHSELVKVDGCVAEIVMLSIKSQTIVYVCCGSRAAAAVVHDDICMFTLCAFRKGRGKCVGVLVRLIR